ncbi:hypothetical protein [Streptomyces sp. TLI_171]|uniref:hypothetical protein n=1 Tax=Streptomyces sp. TLI_171 TaxID=1938859 RepID=UPI000C197850|nr:hypothetical protein [Streptomyces sp. TLI_171]RKE21770.1 hypothetical protein BX266_5170 [Streptomyces sp. TLI_171]
MTGEEIPGARAELRRRGEQLFAEFAALLAELAPGQAPPAALPEHPDIVAWGNPLSFAHYRQVAFDRPPNDPGLPARAEALLADWQLTRERSESGAVVLHAQRDGLKLRLHFHPRRGLTLCRAETEPMVLHRAEEFVRPEPLLSPGDVRPGWELCPECEGLGRCEECWGRGWTTGGVTWVIGPTEGRATCRECRGGRACPICRGAGQRPRR